MTSSTTVGIIAAPELAEEIASELIKTLPEILKKYIDKDIDWKVGTVVDPLTGAAETVDEIFQEATTYRSNREWGYIICLTDLPIFHEEKVVAVDINKSLNISLISIPAFGFRPALKRVKEIIIYTFEEMAKNKGNQEKEAIKLMKALHQKFPIAPVRKTELYLKETGDFHQRVFITPKIYGKMRLISGMTFANNPLKMMSSLTNVVAIAFTTGAFGMIFTTMWKLSHLFSNLRLTAITFAAIIGMIIWISIAHNLWEPISTSSAKKISKLYNLTTAMTLLIAISAYYIVVFMLFFITSVVFIPPDFLTETLNLETTVNVIHYFKIAWFAASLSIVAGAIGAGLINEELLRDSTYGYRQNKRYEDIQDSSGD